MTGEEFLKFNNGKQFSISNFKEIREKDLKDADAETKRLFNIFAGDDHILQADEAQSLWNKIQAAAATNNKGDNSVFDNNEMQKFLDKDKDIKAAKTKFSLDALTNIISQVFALQETQPIQQPALTHKELTNDDLVEYTPEEIDDMSVQTLSDDVAEARRLYDAQNAEQGGVSRFVNAAKENFDTEFASSRVGRYIQKEELCVDLLNKSKSPEGLSQKEYLEAKIDFIIEMIQNLEQYSLRTEITQDAINISLNSLTFGLAGEKKTKNSQELEDKQRELEYLKSVLARLSPEEINLMISQLLSVNENPETQSEYNMSFGGKTNTARPQTITSGGLENQMLSFSPLEYEAQASDGSLASLSQTEAYKKMSFEEVFEKERGVMYNSEAVMDYTQKDSYMQFLLGIHNRREQVADLLKEARFIKQTQAIGSEQVPGEIQHNARTLMMNLTTALKSIYGNDANKIQEFIDSIYPNIGNNKFLSQKPEVITNEQGEFVRLSFGVEGETTTIPNNNGEGLPINLPNLNINIDSQTIQSMVNIAEKLQANINTTYEQALNGKTIEEYGEEVSQAYTKAYGKGDAQAIANEYIQSQQEGVGYVKTGVSTLGMAVMVAGQLIPVGGQVAAAMMYGGLATATLGSSAVTATELLTKEGKVTQEELKELAKEVGTSLALTATGMKIGKISEGVYLAVAKHAPKLLALASEIGVDATMSLIADLAITGEIDLTGEGIAQLQNVLVGILHAKGNFRNYLDTHAGNVKIEVNGKECSTDDVVGVKSGIAEDLFQTADINKFKQTLSDENITLLTQPGVIDGYETFHFTKNNITYEVFCEDGQIKAFLADVGNDTFKCYKIEDNKNLIEISEEELNTINAESFRKQKDIFNSGADIKADNNIPNCDIATLENILQKQGIEVRVYKDDIYNDGFLNYTKDGVEYYLNYSDGKIVAGRAGRPGAGKNVKRYEINDDGKFIEITEDKYLSILSDAKFQHLKTENPDAYNTIINFEKALQSKPSIFDLREYLDKMGVTDFDAGFYFNYEGKAYNINTDKNGNAIGVMIRDEYTQNAHYLIYDKNGNAVQTDYSKYAETFNSGEPQWIAISLYKLGLKKELIQNIIEHGSMEADVPRFNELFIKDVTSLIKTPEDEKLFYFLISDKSTLSKKGVNKYTFNSQEILNIMKSSQAKNVINEKIANNQSISRSDIEKIDKGLLTSTSSYKRSDKRDLSYKIQDWDEDPMRLMMVYDQAVDFFNSQVPPGEVICARGQLLCNTGSKLVPINLTKEKFMELFPIEDRFKINQQGLGDCWLVTTFGTLMDSPKGRAAIYRMFRQDGDDIYIKFPDEDVELGFKDGNLNTLMPLSIYIDDKKLKIGIGIAEVKASKGIRLLERAYSVHRHDGYKEDVTTQMVTDIFFMNKQMQRLSGGHSTDAIEDIVGKDKVKTTSYSEPDEIIKQLEDNLNDPNKIFTFSTKEKGSKSSYDLYGNHAYHIVGYNKETGMISISNPWHNNKIQEIPVYEWLNYISNFEVSELK